MCVVEVVNESDTEHSHRCRHKTLFSFLLFSLYLALFFFVSSDRRMAAFSKCIGFLMFLCWNAISIAIVIDFVDSFVQAQRHHKHFNGKIK